MGSQGAAEGGWEVRREASSSTEGTLGVPKGTGGRRAPYLVALGGGDGLQVLAGDAHHLLAVLQVDGAHPPLRSEQGVREQRLRGDALSRPLCPVPPQHPKPQKAPLPAHRDAADDTRLSHRLAVQVGVPDLHLDVGGHPVTGALLDARTRGVGVVTPRGWRPRGHRAVPHRAGAGAGLGAEKKMA